MERIAKPEHRTPNMTKTAHLTRRRWMQATTALGVGAISMTPGSRIATADDTSAEPLDVGTQLELAIDPRWIDSLEGLQLTPHAPVPREVVLKSPGVGDDDRDSWEYLYGYLSVMKDGDIYRMYYRHVQPSSDQDGHEFSCYAESRDAIHWTKPNLGLFNIPNSEDGNAIAEENRVQPDDDDSEHFPCISHNMRPFVDTRPNVPDSERFKALGGGFNSSRRPAGYWALVSQDGIHWKKLRKEWVIDRSNWPHGSDSTPACAFWSEAEGQYVAYIRIRVNPANPSEGKVRGLRWIGRLTSDDFVHWSKVTPMRPLDTDLDVGKIADRNVHFYTNETQPYFRNRQLLIATPTRYFVGTVFSDEQLAKMSPEVQQHQRESSVGYTDAVLLTTRPGQLFYNQPFAEAYLRPGLDIRNWSNRSTYPFVRFVPTGEAEISQFVQHGRGTYSYVQRYSLRTDGFASVRASLAGGELITRPLKFDGRQLVINYSTSGAGSVRVEIQDRQGIPLPGYTLDDAVRHVGDSIEQVVRWKSASDLSRFQDQPIRLRMVMHDADLYSFRFA